MPTDGEFNALSTANAMGPLRAQTCRCWFLSLQTIW